MTSEPRIDSPGTPGGGMALGRLDRALFRVETFFNLVAGLFIFALMLLGVVQIFGRKLFNMPIFGYIDMVELAMATFAFLGIAYCQRLGGHVRMEIILGRLKGRTLWSTEIFGMLVAMFVVGVLIYYGFTHFLRAYELGDSTIDAEYPVWPSKLLVPLAFSLLWLRLMIQLAGYLRLLRDPDAAPVGVPVIETVEEHARQEIGEALGDAVDGGAPDRSGG